MTDIDVRSRCLLYITFVVIISTVVTGEWKWSKVVVGRRRCPSEWTVLVKRTFTDPACSTADRCNEMEVVDGSCIDALPACPHDFVYNCNNRSTLCDLVAEGCVQDSLLNECGAVSWDKWGFFHSSGRLGACQFSLNGHGELDDSSEAPTVVLTLHQLPLAADAKAYRCRNVFYVTADGRRYGNCSSVTARPAGTVVEFDASNVTIHIESRALASAFFLIEWKYSNFDEDHEARYRVIEPDIIFEEDDYLYSNEYDADDDDDEEETGHITMIAVLASLIIVLVVVVVFITVCVLRRSLNKNASDKGQNQSTSTNSNADHARIHSSGTEETRADTQRPLPDISGDPEGGNLYEEIDESGTWQYSAILEQNSHYDNVKKTFKSKPTNPNEPLKMLALTGNESDDVTGNGELIAASRETDSPGVVNAIVLHQNSLYNGDSPITKDTGGPKTESRDRGQAVARENSLNNNKILRNEPHSQTAEVFLRENSLYNEKEPDPIHYVEIDSGPN